MSSVKAFVEGKQHVKAIDPQRYAVGNQHRVLVPPTKLNKVISTSVDHQSKASPFPIGSSTHKPEFVSRREPNGFDTDAESLEDTTIVSIKAKRNSHPLAARLLTSSKAMSHAGSQHSRDDSNGQEFSNRLDQNRNVSEYGHEYLSDIEGGDDDQESQSFNHLIGNFQSEEFVNFKRHNVLDKNFLQDFSFPPATGTELQASSDALGNARGLAGVSLPKLSSPIRPDANIVVDLKLQDNRRQDRENVPPSNLRLMDETEQAPKRPLRSLHEVPLAGAESTRRFPNRASRPSTQNSGADKDPERVAAKPTSVIERLVHDKTRDDQTSADFQNHGFSLSSLSDNESMEKVADSELLRENRKRSRSLDHDLDQLASMTFQQLRDECFDDVPNPGNSQASPESKGDFLLAKLQTFSTIRDSRERDGQQQAFFDSLTLEQYGESGDVVGRKLGETITKLRGIRDRKRMIAVNFESEVAKREQSVRASSAALKREKTVMMRQTEELTSARPP